MSLMFRQLRYLVELAREKHFARAAASCHVTQPALSAGIKQLEEQLGVLIVERGQRFVGFTPEGERVLSWAQRALSDLDGLAQQLGEMRAGLSGHLQLGAIPVALPFLHRLLTPFAEQHPAVTATVLMHTSADIQRGLDTFSLDAGVTYLDSEPLARVRSVPLYRERYLLLTPADGPLAGRFTVRWDEAAETPLALLTPDMQNRRIVDSFFRQAGTSVEPRFETNSILMLLSRLRSGALSSIVPDGLPELVQPMPHMLALPLTDPVATQTVGVVVADREPEQPVARALMLVAESLAEVGYS
jgi:DNA-binding transcriptional LysR family regulator